MDDYYKDFGRISNSMLSLLKRSPELYHRKYIAGIDDEEKSDAFAIGSLVHCMVLEKDNLDERYAVCPKVDRRTKEGKATYAQFAAASEGKEVVDQETFDEACLMAASIERHEVVKPLLAAPRFTEYAINFEIGNQPTKSRLDLGLADGSVILDIKTTKDVTPDEFARSVVAYGYHRQAAFYKEAVRQHFGTTPRFIFACVQSSFPYLTGCYELDDAAIDIGWIEIQGLLEELQQRHAANDWSSEFTKGINVLSLPRWYS